MSDTLKKSEKPLVVLIVGEYESKVLEGVGKDVADEKAGGTTTVARTLARYLLDKEEKRVEVSMGLCMVCYTDQSQFVRIGQLAPDISVRCAEKLTCPTHS